MKRLTFIVLALGGLAVSAHGAERWNMFERRLGMFIHWGIYSVGEWHSQQQWRQRMSRAEYEKFVGRFTAERFSADAFVDVAESAGAEYIVFTSKHHDGFCMWDSAVTDYKVTNTPARRDVLKELADACRRRGMKLGFYYSNPDWHHPNAYNPKSTHQVPPEPGDKPDLAAYREYVKAQVRELLTGYGEIVCFFWDIPTHVDAPDMNALVRSLQPGIMVNNRGWSDDWIYSLDVEMGEMNYKGAAFVSAVLTRCQRAPVDMLMFYDARVSGGMNNLFDPMTLEPSRGYYPFKAWAKMRRMGTEAAVKIDGQNDIYVMAAVGPDGHAGILVTRYLDDDNVTPIELVTVRVEGRSLAGATCHLTDKVRFYTEIYPTADENGAITLPMKPNSFAFIEL